MPPGHVSVATNFFVKLCLHVRDLLLELTTFFLKLIVIIRDREVILLVLRHQILDVVFKSEVALLCKFKFMFLMITARFGVMKFFHDVFVVLYESVVL